MKMGECFKPSHVLDRPGLVPRPCRSLIPGLFLLHGLGTRLGQSWPEVVLFSVAFG